MKKVIAIVLTILTVASLAACGSDRGNKIEETKPAAQTTQSAEKETAAAQSEAEATEAADSTEEATETAAAADGYIKAGTKGAGEETITSKYCTMTIPEGMEYEVEFSTQNEGETGSFSLTLNKAGKYDMETFEISTTRMISSIEDAVKECERMNSFGDGAQIEYGDDVTYGGITYKQVKITTATGTPSDFLVYYYKNYEGLDTYVEIKSTEDAFGNIVIPIDDTMMVSMVESIQYK